MGLGIQISEVYCLVIVLSVPDLQGGSTDDHDLKADASYHVCTSIT